jgi:hypothetical protein
MASGYIVDRDVALANACVVRNEVRFFMIGLGYTHHGECRAAVTVATLCMLKLVWPRVVRNRVANAIWESRFDLWTNDEGQRAAVVLVVRKKNYFCAIYFVGD